MQQAFMKKCHPFVIPAKAGIHSRNPVHNTTNTPSNLSNTKHRPQHKVIAPHSRSVLANPARFWYNTGCLYGTFYWVILGTPMLIRRILKSFSSKSLTAIVILAVIACGSSIVIGRSALPLQPGALEYTGTFALQNNDPNLTGQGVTIAAVCRSITYDGGLPQEDYRINTDHDCFATSNITFADSAGENTGISAHATAIGAILAGADPNGFHAETGSFQYRGAAPKAETHVYEFWRFIVNYIYGGRQLDSDILTFSLGLAFEDWWTRGIDNLIEETGLITVAGVGNGTEAYDPLLYPGSNANVIGVGVIDSAASAFLASGLNKFSMPLPAHSSTGPTYDARSKPDIVAPGNCLVPTDDSENEYGISGDYTSFAAPVVSGSAALLVQKVKTTPRLQAALANNNGNCVIKAILLTSADKLPGWHKGEQTKDDDHNVPLDKAQGAGALNAAAAADLLDAGQGKPADAVAAAGWDNNRIKNNQLTEKAYAFKIDKPDTEQFITATLVWNFAYQNEYPFAKGPDQSDLRLELWADEGNDKWIMVDHSDSKTDNTEHIYYPVDPNHTDYELVVISNSQNEKPQKYAIAWNVTTPKPKTVYWYDLNGDGKIDKIDLGIAIENFTTDDSEDRSSIGDVNFDGTVDINDIRLLMNSL